jgi:hypothetical protein
LTATSERLRTLSLKGSKKGRKKGGERKRRRRKSIQGLRRRKRRGGEGERGRRVIERGRGGGGRRRRRGEGKEGVLAFSDRVHFWLEEGFVRDITLLLFLCIAKIEK